MLLVLESECASIRDSACIFSIKDKITCAFIRVGATNRANTDNCFRQLFLSYDLVFIRFALNVSL